MEKSLRVLIVEDSEDDALLAVRELKKGGYEPEYMRVEKAEAMRTALREKTWDLILCDYQMPKFNGLAAIEVLNETGIDIPLIIVSGAIGEEVAADCMRSGARDTVMKDNLPRLIPAIERELKEIQSRRERARVEEALLQSAREWQNTFDATNDAIWILDQDQRVLRSNKTAERFFHRPFEEMIGKPCWEIVHGTTEPIPECPILQVRKSLRRETLQLQAGERWFEVNVDPILDAAGRYSGAVHIVSDVTERMRVEEEKTILADIGRVIGSTLEIDKVYEQVAAEIGKLIPFDSLIVSLCVARKETLEVAYVSGLDIPGRRVGDSFPLRGTMLDEIIRTKRGIIVQSKNPEELVDKFPSLVVTVQAGISSILSVPLISRDELVGNLVMRSQKPDVYTERDLRLAERIGMQIAGAIANAQLYTDLGKTETSLRESERRFRSLFEQAAVGVAEIVMKTGRFITVNRRLCEMVGRTEEELLTITFMAITHPEDSRLHVERARKILTGEIDHFSLEKRYLRKDGEIVWVNISVSPLWKPGEAPSCMMTVVEDITDRKRTETKLQHTLDSLRKSLSTTINVLVSAVETRDPYTSGHQIRSADLSRAIAMEMGLPHDKIEGIRIAGSIHDIGKLSIPAEILSKPIKLTELEFSLIKDHARQGYEILKNVESPWALAEIVHQHHERMDGSGYPRNLKGDDILIEARILAVADVVEAMASHRPYRPGLGIDAALNELEKNRGVLYDTAVTDACLRIFREKGYKLN